MIPDSEPDSYFRVVVVAVAGTHVAAARTPSTIACDVVCFSSRVLAPLRHTPLCPLSFPSLLVVGSPLMDDVDDVA